jgi:hypothetical protein
MQKKKTYILKKKKYMQQKNHVQVEMIKRFLTDSKEFP